MALVSYIGIGWNISQISLFVTVYIVKISIVLELVSLHTLTQYDFIGIQAQVFDDFIGDPYEGIADNSALVLWIGHVTQ